MDNSKSQGSSSSKKTKIYVGVFVPLGILALVGAVIVVIFRSRSGRFNRMRDTHNTNSVTLSDISK
jgi:hypothetical protein